jgi:hypothetical protein
MEGFAAKQIHEAVIEQEGPTVGRLCIGGRSVEFLGLVGEGCRMVAMRVGGVLSNSGFD